MRGRIADDFEAIRKRLEDINNKRQQSICVGVCEWQSACTEMEDCKLRRYRSTLEEMKKTNPVRRETVRLVRERLPDFKD